MTVFMNLFHDGIFLLLLLMVANGAPIRVRVERQLGYKMAKFIMRIELVENFEQIADGHGGYWEDHSGYEWYAGI